MNYRGKLKMAVIGALAVLVGLAWGLPNMCAAASDKALPNLIIITSYGQGSTGHALASGVSEVIAKATPMDSRVTPGAGDIVRITPLRKKTGELTLATNATGYLALLGKGDFAKAKWGPQPIRLVWLGSVLANAIPFTRGDSGIRTVGDLKGKKVADIAGASTYWACLKGALAFGGLTENDVIKVPIAGYSKHFDALLEGVVDVALGSTNSAKAMETAGSPHGIHWLNYNPKDQAAWARLHQEAPWIMPLRVTSGAGIKPDNPQNLCGYPYSLFAYPSCRNDVTEAVTQALAENHKRLQSIHKEFARWDSAHALDISLLKDILVPYHDGSVAYFKKIGKWTPEHEAWQQKVLALEKERMAAWKAKQ